MKCVSKVLAMLAVAAISTAAFAAAEKADAPKPLTGMIAKVDATAKTIDVKVRADGGPKTVTVTVADDAAITLDGKAATLGDLKEGLRVKVSPAEGKATKVDAMKPAAKKGEGH